MLTKPPKIIVILYISILLINIPITLKAQDSTALKNITNKKIESIHQRADEYNNKIDKQTAKYLNKIQKQEQKLQRKLSKIDSTAAKQLFEESIAHYKKLDEKLKNTTSKVKNNKLTQYIAGLDSATTGLQFLGENIPLLTNVKDAKNKIENAINSYETLKNKLEVTKDITQYIGERKELIKETFQKYNLGKYLKKYNKQAYYYTAQIKEYKEALKDPVKAEKLVINLLNKIPQFKDFFAKFSQIGQLFPQPKGGVNNIASLAGLQTRTQVLQQIQTTIGSAAGGPNAGIQMLQQNIQQAQNQLSQLRNKIQEAGGSNSDFEMPNFKPNTQKTKSFLKRVDINTNLQTNKGNGVIPNAADIALGVGYKIDDKKIIGVQVAYKLGLGNGFRNIKLTTEGVSYRSYTDIKFKHNFWITGGYELTNFTNISPLSLWRGAGGEVWSKSALLGLSKKYSITKKRKGEAKLLYNFLWQQQPNAQKIIFRTGLNF